MNNEYPMSMLDDIAVAAHKEEWEYTLPSDFDASLAYALATLSSREGLCAIRYYRDGKTYREIGEEISLTRERVRQITAKAIHRLAHPTRRRFLEIGVQGVIEEKVHAARKDATVDRIDAAVTALSEIAERLGAVKEGEVMSAFVELSKDKLNAKRSIPIESLGLSVRTTNCIQRAGLNTVGDVVDTPTYELMMIRNLGKKSYDELVDKIHRIGLFFCDETEDANEGS